MRIPIEIKSIALFFLSLFLYLIENPKTKNINPIIINNSENPIIFLSKLAYCLID